MSLQKSTFLAHCLWISVLYGQPSSLVSIGAGGKLEYKPYANWGQTNAVNTIPDFSFAGYKGGGVALPKLPVVETVLPVTGDARSVIQAAIDRVSAAPPDVNGFRGAVLLKSGRYEVDGSLVIRTNGVVLRGEGQNPPEKGGTELVAASRTQHSFIKILGAETTARTVSELVLDTKQYPAQNTWLAFNVLAGVANELDGNRVISFHIFTNANQYTNYSSREDVVNKPPTLELTLPSSVIGTDTVISLAAIADTYVQGGADSVKNFGSESSIAIKYTGENAATTREGYLKFDLSNVNNTPTKAELKLFAKYDLSQAPIPVLSHSVSFIDDDSWDEKTLTYQNRPRSNANAATRRITTSYVPTGVTSFTVDNAAGLSVGDTIKVVRTPNDYWINTLAMAQYGWTAPAYRIKYPRVIKAIAGNTITIHAPIVQAMEDAFGGGEIIKEPILGQIGECGVENMLLSSVYASDVDEQHGWTAIVLSEATGCWVRNVTARYFGYSCVLLDQAHNTTVENCAMLDPKSITTGSRKYSFNIDKGSFNLFQRCFTRGGRHDFVTGSQVAGPNVFVDCAAVQTYADIGPHHRYATGLLFDNIRGGEIRVQNRGAMGTGHGWAGAQTMFWNCQSDASEFKVESPVGAMNWGIGCSGLIRNGGGFWENWKTRVVPRSLYYQQLQDRLGTTAVENVTLPEQREGRDIWPLLLSWAGVGELKTATTVDETNGEIPKEFSLYQNYPNPWNPTTQIEYSLPTESHVRLTLTDALGREVGIVVDGVISAGRHKAQVQASNLSSGVYVYRITAGGITLAKKMIVMK